MLQISLYQRIAFNNRHIKKFKLFNRIYTHFETSITTKYVVQDQNNPSQCSKESKKLYKTQRNKIDDVGLRKIQVNIFLLVKSA